MINNILIIIRNSAHVLMVLAVIAYSALSFLGEVYPDVLTMDFSPSWLLLPVLLFGIISVRLPMGEPHTETTIRTRRWPYVLASVLVLGAILWLSTMSWSMVWRIIMGIYAIALLVTILLVVFED